DDRAVVGSAKDGGSGYERIGAGGMDRPDVVPFDAAVDLQADRLTPRLYPSVDAATGLAQLVQRVRNELLATEPRVHRHEQHEVELVHDVLHPVQRGGGVKHQAGPAAMVANQGQRTVRVARSFRVEGDDIGAGLGELRDNGVHRFDHQVDVDRRRGVGADCFAHHGADRQIRHVMVVHYIEVDPVSAGIHDIADFFSKAGEIGGKQAGRDTDVWQGHGQRNQKRNAATMSVLQFDPRLHAGRTIGRSKLLAVAALTALLASCATVDVEEEAPSTPSGPDISEQPLRVPSLQSIRHTAAPQLEGGLVPVSWAALPSWQDDDLSRIWPAFINNCKGLMRPTGGSQVQQARATPVAWQPVCAAAAQTQPQSAAEILRFIEQHLQPWRLLDEQGKPAKNTVTGYYEPLVRASRTRGGPYQ